MYEFKKETEISFEGFSDSYYYLVGTSYYVGVAACDKYDAAGAGYLKTFDVCTADGEQLLDDEEWPIEPDELLPGVSKDLETFLNGYYYGNNHLRYRS